MTCKPGEWYRYRSTTEKISDDLNHIEESGDTVESIHGPVGRDWVILCRKGRTSPFGPLVSDTTATLARLLAAVERQEQVFQDLPDALLRGFKRGYADGMR